MELVVTVVVLIFVFAFLERSPRNFHRRRPTMDDDENKLRQWEYEQAELATQVITCDDLDIEKDIDLVGGVDISFDQHVEGRACAALVVMRGAKVVAERFSIFTLKEPYVSGFLAFREVPALLDLIGELPPHLVPQVILVDGNGVLHARRCGLASHLGVLSGIATIGVAKTLYEHDGLRVPETLPARLIGASGECWGIARSFTASGTHPIFISIGHRLSLASAERVVERYSRYRVPEPIRRADISSRALLRKNQVSGNQPNEQQ